MEPWSPITALLGAALVLLTAYDLLKTVLTAAGGGPVTVWISARVWRLALRAAGTAAGADEASADGARRDPPDWLARVGPAIAVLTLLMWLAGMWSGWTLIFSGSEGAVLTTPDKLPSSFFDRLYYAGYTLTTLGPGDFVPGDELWQFVTVLAAVNGLFLFTMAITYIVPIVSATAQQRQLATLVNALGDDPSDILVRSWHEGGFDTLEDHLLTMMPMVAAAREQHLAYPILHFFHSAEPEAALPVQLAVLDETLILLDHGVEPDAQPAAQTLRPLRLQIEGYLATLASAQVDPVEPAPPSSFHERCAEAGIPMRSRADFERALEEEAERRSLLLGLVQSDGWHWSHVTDEDTERGTQSG